MVRAGVLALVGNTPLVELQRLPEPDSARVLGKLEGRNPSGSVKDRAVLAILEDAAERGLLAPGGTIVEASAGNTALALAVIGAALGYRVVITAPESVPLERRRLITRFGAEVRLTPAPQGMAGSQEAARRMAERDGALFLDQFRHPATVRAHQEGTGREVLEQAQGVVDAFVAGVGTGGTITGAGGLLKARLPGVRVVAVEPARSPLLSRGAAGDHGIPGLGPDFVPPVLDRALIDQVVTVSEEEARRTMLEMAVREGLLVGLSSGAATAAALQVARDLGPGATVVTVWPDTGERYVAPPP